MPKELIDQLMLLPSLEDGWNGYKAPKPNPNSLQKTKDFLVEILYNKIVPISIVPSAEGGVGIVFKFDEWYIDLEIFNDGKMVGCFSKPENIHVWEVFSVQEASQKITEFMSNRSTNLSLW